MVRMRKTDSSDISASNKRKTITMEVNLDINKRSINSVFAAFYERTYRALYQVFQANHEASKSIVMARVSVGVVCIS